jgi:hypothetical protein
VVPAAIDTLAAGIRLIKAVKERTLVHSAWFIVTAAASRVVAACFTTTQYARNVAIAVGGGVVQLVMVTAAFRIVIAEATTIISNVGRLAQGDVVSRKRHAIFKCGRPAGHVLLIAATERVMSYYRVFFENALAAG